MIIQRTLFLPIALGLVLCTGNQATSAVIENGDFSRPGTEPVPFKSWSTIHIPTIFEPAPPSGAGGAALFATVGALDQVQLEQTFFLPENAVQMTFEIEITTAVAGTTSPSAANDSFQAGLFDDVGEPINPIDLVLPAFYSIDSSGFVDFADGVDFHLIGTNRGLVSFDLTAVPAQEVTLEFLLLGDDDGFATTVVLDNVVIFVPEPSGFAVAGVIAAGLLSRRRSRRVAT